MKLSPAILAAGIAAFSPQLSAEEIFVSAVGAKQGPFAGEVTMKGFEGKVRAVAFSHELLTPIDPAGSPVGRRQHKPIVITKRVGASSPQFFQAWIMNEPLKSVTIDFTDTVDGAVGTAAQRKLVYQITLQNAVVVRIAQRLEPTATSTPSTGPVHLEEISLAYQAITVTFPAAGGGRTASDSANSTR